MTLRVGVPAEIKVDEFRVALTPEGVRELDAAGVEVVVQAGAGIGSGIDDDLYRRAGARVVDRPAEVWEQDLVCKVKEPLEAEFGFFRPDLVLFTFLHLAAYPRVADALLAAGTTGIAYETVQA
ncbi:MAG TPA: alanine dehydrogenase, partial [Acidimicrobiales bacterium]|nr:alanine dehydrogenase [Acidimicrobiales bacterium]